MLLNAKKGIRVDVFILVSRRDHIIWDLYSLTIELVICLPSKSTMISPLLIFR